MARKASGIGTGETALLCYLELIETHGGDNSMKKLLIVIVALLLATSSCSNSNPIPTVIPTEVKPSSTPQPSHTPTATITPEPTQTNTPVPTATAKPTSTPLPPQAWIWSSSLSNFYEDIYALGYAAEMFHHQDGYWLIEFDDLNSYFTHEGWWWYGNSILAWAGDDDRTDGLVTQIGLRKNYLSFPTSDIDGKADRFFRKMLKEFGYEADEIDNVMQIASSGLVDARSEIGDHICYGQLSSGEYIGVRLLEGSIAYVYFVDIRTAPIC
jgi:hypothetical protein